jgi:hypothetical protein
MTREARWVHGNTMVPEVAGPGRFANVDGVAWTDVVGLPRGWGKAWRGRANTFNFFHVSIPAPTTIGTVRPQLDKVYVFFDIGTTARVENIHVWDGPNRIFVRDGLAVTGNRISSIQWESNAWDIPNNPPVWYGLGISVGVRFPGVDANVTFSTAGADFLVP